MHDYGLLENFYSTIELQYSMTIMGSKVHTQNHEMSNDLGPLYFLSSLKTCLADFYFEFYIKGILSAIAAMMSLAEKNLSIFSHFQGLEGLGEVPVLGDPMSTCDEHFPFPLMLF